VIQRVFSVLAAIAALVEGLANPGSAVPSKVQPYLVLAGSALIAVERIIVFLESKPDPVASVEHVFDTLLAKVPVKTPAVPPVPPTTSVTAQVPPAPPAPPAP